MLKSVGGVGCAAAVLHGLTRGAASRSGSAGASHAQESQQLSVAACALLCSNYFHELTHFRGLSCAGVRKHACPLGTLFVSLCSNLILLQRAAS